MGLFNKKQAPQPTIAIATPPHVSEADLAEAAALIAQFDRSLGNSDATWAAIDAIAARGGFRGMQAALMEVMDGAPSAEVADRPWRWWAEASRLAYTTGDYVLSARIFMMFNLYVKTMLPDMLPAHTMQTGIDYPKDDSFRAMARCADESLTRLPPAMLIHDTATGKVNVAAALDMARDVRGD